MRDSKNILHAKLGVSPMERQYGGGLDDAYMNRRRSSAFADPDATSAFASPMSQGGLPTIYREQGGPLPITSVYGQGIPRIVYRENGGDFGFYGDYTQDNIDQAMDAAAAEEDSVSSGDLGDENDFTDPGLTQGQSAALNPSPPSIGNDQPSFTRTPLEPLHRLNREEERRGIINFWKDRDNPLRIPSLVKDMQDRSASEEKEEKEKREEIKERADKYWHYKAGEEAKNKEEERQRQHAINTAGSIYPGFNILTGKPLTKQEQTRAALQSSFTPVIERNPLGFLHGKPERINIVKENVERKWAEDWEKEQAEKEDMEKRDSEYAKVIADHRIKHSNLSPNAKDEVFKDLNMAIKGLTGSKEARAIYDTLNILLKGAETNRKTGGGLSTIYRDVGGSLGDWDEGIAAEYNQMAAAEEAANQATGPTGEDDWTTEEAKAQLGAMRGPSKTIQELEEDKELGYSPVELMNIYQANKDTKNAGRMAQNILSDTARNALLSSLYGKVGGKGGWDGVENFIANMSPEDLANFNAAASGSSWLGDIKGDDPSKGWRFGGPEGTLEDIFEKSVIGAEEGLQKLLKDQKKKEVKKEEKSVDKGSTLGSLLNYIEKGISKLTGGKSLTPETIESMKSFAKSQGDEFIPTSVSDSTIGKVLSFGLPGPLGMLPKPIGVYRTKNGLEFDVAADRSLSLRTPTPNIDYGNDVSTTSDKPEKKKKEVKKEEEKKSYMKDYFSGLQSLDNTGDLKNFYERKSLEYIYPNKTRAEINAMINKP